MCINCGAQGGSIDVHESGDCTGQCGHRMGR